MPTNLVLNITNMYLPALTSGKIYNDAGDFVCSYPLLNLTALDITVTNGSKYITTTGDFITLLGCDIQNNNTPVYSWLWQGGDGRILEIDYVVSATQAVLKTSCSYPTGTTDFYIVDYYGSPRVQETLLSNTTPAPITAFIIGTKVGPLSLNINAGQTISLGQEPIAANIGAAPEIALTVKYAK